MIKGCSDLRGHLLLIGGGHYLGSMLLARLLGEGALRERARTTMRGNGLNTGAPLADSAGLVVASGGGGRLVDLAGSDGILGAHHLGPVARFLGGAERFLGDGVAVGGEDTGVPLAVLLVEDGIVVPFLGSLAVLDVAGIDEILEATDADALSINSVSASAGNIGDDATLIALGVLFGGKAGLEFLVGVFAERRDEVDLRPAVEADLARTTATR